MTSPLLAHAQETKAKVHHDGYAHHCGACLA